MNICRSRNGHVKLWHKIEDSDLVGDVNAFYVFTRMLLMAHYESNFSSVRFKGKQYKLQAGEFSASVNELTNYLKISAGTLRRVIKRLENDKRIKTKTDRQTTIFYVCNWNDYQGDQKAKKTNERINDVSNEGTNDVSNEGTNVTGVLKNIKNIKNIKKEDKSSSVERDLVLQQNKAHKWICSLFSKNPARFKLSDKRRTHLKARLRDIGAEGVRKAFENIASSSFHRGDNDRGWSIDTDPYWLLQNYERTEKWRDLVLENIGSKPDIDLSKIKMEDY